MRHRFLWSYVAMVAANFIFYNVLRLPGLVVVPIGVAAYLIVKFMLPWQDPPGDWREKCLKNRVLRPKHQNVLWESIRERVERGGAPALMTFDKDAVEHLGNEALIGIVHEFLHEEPLKKHGITLGDAVETRYGLAIAGVTSPVGGGKKTKKRKKLPALKIGELPSLHGA